MHERVDKEQRKNKERTRKEYCDKWRKRRDFHFFSSYSSQSKIKRTLQPKILIQHLQFVSSRHLLCILRHCDQLSLGLLTRKEEVLLLCVAPIYKTTRNSNTLNLTLGWNTY